MHLRKVTQIQQEFFGGVSETSISTELGENRGGVPQGSTDISNKDKLGEIE